MIANPSFIPSFDFHYSSAFPSHSSWAASDL